MKIAILSDTHSRYATVEKALGLIRRRKLECVLHCGDIEDGETVRLFRDFPTHFVFGNCDYDREELRQAMAEIGATVQEPFGHLELGGVKIAWMHGDDKGLMHDVEHSGHFDFLFYGHTHRMEEHRTGPTRVINPGALHRAQPKTFLLLELPSGKMEVMGLGEPV